MEVDQFQVFLRNRKKKLLHHQQNLTKDMLGPLAIELTEIK